LKLDTRLNITLRKQKQRGTFASIARFVIAMASYSSILFATIELFTFSGKFRCCTPVGGLTTLCLNDERI